MEKNTRLVAGVTWEGLNRKGKGGEGGEGKLKGEKKILKNRNVHYEPIYVE